MALPDGIFTISDDASRKEKGRGKEERRCVYLDLQLGKNSRRLSSCDDKGREEETRERKKRIVDSAKRMQKTVSGLYKEREKIEEEEFRLLSEDASV